MPQPLSHVDPKLGFVLGGGGPPHSPKAAKSVLSVITRWAEIENIYSQLLAKIAHADPITITAVHQAMVSGDARRAALIAAAEASTPPEQSCLIQATLGASDASRKQRNAFAHHVWGTLNDGERLILVNPKDAARYYAQTMARIATREPPADIDRSAIMVWSERDLQEAEALAALRHKQTAQLSFIVEETFSTEPMRAKLLADPDIARLYEKFLRGNAD